MKMFKKPSPKRKMIFCEPCSYKRILEANETPEDLFSIKVSPVPGGIPELDPVTGKTKVKPVTDQTKKLKCPRCGRGVVVKDLQPAYANAFKQIDDKAEKERLEADRKKRLEDGEPSKKKADSDFYGKL